jgi:hypothetical protein
MKNGKQPAFTGIVNEAYQEGLTKREYFAGLAMQALMSNPNVVVNDTRNIKQCVLIADKLLKQLSDE